MSSPTPAEAGGFEALGLDRRLLRAIQDLGFESPTPIQAEALPLLLEGHDVIGRARTGSGKTAAFGLPLLEHMINGKRGVKAIVLAPTRELAIQVSDALETFATHLKLSILTVYGGTSYTTQLRALKHGVDVVVATPGRAMDLMDRGKLDLSGVQVVVLDEADEMLRMGFVDDVETILAATPDTRQTALFSATMPPRIRKIADTYLENPVEVQVEDGALSVGHIDQRWIKVNPRDKTEALRRLLAGEARGSTLVFARTKRSCAETSDLLAKNGLQVDALHGDLNQAARERVLARFRSERLKIVVATDVAARGLDVNHITHVVNFDMPNDPETYVHRIGRTGRAGRQGNAITFVTANERRRLKDIQRATKQPIAEMPLPSDNDIANLRKRELAKDLFEAQAQGLDKERVLVQQLVDELGSAEEVAAAALRLLAKANPILELAPIPKKKRKDRKRPDIFDGEFVDVFLSVGRKHGVRPGDLVGALANEAGIPGESLGRITIVDGKSFVGVRPDVMDRVLALGSLEIRGSRAAVKRARGGPEGLTPPPKKRRFNKRKNFGTR